jgi:hypothetical protein
MSKNWFKDLLEKYKDDPDFQKSGIIFELQEQLAEAKQWKDISVHQGLKIKLMEKENAELRERLKSRRGVDEFGGD